MPSEELRKKLLLKKEKSAAELLTERLTGLRVLGYASETDVPAWVADSLREYRRMDSVPDSRIGDGCDRNQWATWCEGILLSVEIGDRFYCRTGLVHFPWVDCQVTDRSWIGSIRDTLGGDLCFVSHDGRSLVVVFEEEYEYIAFGRQVAA
ncbi:hypothetical protein [Streptomyces sp. NPDC023838]|uniref:hypothetical protein n=1 Tax=Streptomyces sp. NPDC023838 TaxID=3154325 RepID=UPI0033D735E3